MLKSIDAINDKSRRDCKPAGELADCYRVPWGKFPKCCVARGLNTLNQTGPILAHSFIRGSELELGARIG